jgi:NAD(P)-dependent dehydrogenase (short-subunit alcohol dehydrogenase family)
MDITNATALVTGANRGLGRELVRQLLERGATKVYATARRPESIENDDPRVVRLALDVTDEAAVRRAAERAGDVTLLVNNAGISTGTDLVTGDLADVRAELDVHFWGTLAVTRAFAPGLAGGAVVNVMSALSFRAYPGAGAYAVAKAAEWMLTNVTRLELAEQGTQVLGAHLAATDTDMMAGWDIPKNDPVVAIGTILDALEAGATEVLTDDDTRAAKASLAD